MYNGVDTRSDVFGSTVDVIGIAEKVAGWLADHSSYNYYSAFDAMTKATGDDLTTLIACYTGQNAGA